MTVLLKVTELSRAMQVFREPDITPSGLSYEQSALQEHLSKVSRPQQVLVMSFTSLMTPLNVTPQVGSTEVDACC